MENKDLINLFFQVLTLMGTMAGGFFAFWKLASTRIDKHFEDKEKEFQAYKIQAALDVTRIYERMDRKCGELVKNDMYQLELKYQKENIDSRFSTLMDFLKLKFDQLDKTIEKLVKHDEEK